jgi:hypothetical protein
LSRINRTRRALPPSTGGITHIGTENNINGRDNGNDKGTSGTISVCPSSKFRPCEKKMGEKWCQWYN